MRLLFPTFILREAGSVRPSKCVFTPSIWLHHSEARAEMGCAHRLGAELSPPVVAPGAQRPQLHCLVWEGAEWGCQEGGSGAKVACRGKASLTGRWGGPLCPIQNIYHCALRLCGGFPLSSQLACHHCLCPVFSPLLSPGLSGEHSTEISASKLFICF